MKKKLLASLAAVALSAGATGAMAAIQSCDDPLASGFDNNRFCFEKFEDLSSGAYTVSFEYQAEKLAGNTDKTLQFGFLFGSESLDATRGLLADSTVSSGWNTYSFLTQAAGDAGLLFALRGVPGPAFALSLQNIQVTAIPEPASLAMLLAGLGAIVFVGRRRRL
jgi:hypothetical protein